MPLFRYDKHFGGKRGAAQDLLTKLKRTYGPKQGEQVFYGMVAKRERRAKRGGKRAR